MNPPVVSNHFVNLLWAVFQGVCIHSSLTEWKSKKKYCFTHQFERCSYLQILIKKTWEVISYMGKVLFCNLMIV